MDYYVVVLSMTEIISWCLFTAPGPVGSLQVIPSISTAELRWTRPPEPNGNIRRYQVWKQDEYGNEASETLYSSYRLYYHFDSLAPNASHTFAVRAYTYRGYGEWTYNETTTLPIRKYLRLQ